MAPVAAPVSSASVTAWLRGLSDPVVAAPTALDNLQSKAPATASVWAAAPFTAAEEAAPVAAAAAAAAVVVVEMAVEARARTGAAVVRAPVAAAPVVAAPVAAAPVAAAAPASSNLDGLRALGHAATRLNVFNFGDKAKEFWLESGKAESLLEWTEVS